MQRVASVLLAVFAVIVLAGAVYVISDDKAPKSASGVTYHPAPSSATVPSVGTAPSAAGTSVPPSGAGTVGSSAPARRTVVFVGDDWTSGVGASAPDRSFTALIGTDLGVDVVVLGNADTGYARSTSSAGDYADRVAAVVAAKPDLVVVSGGRNDVTLSPGAVSAQATALFGGLHTALPDVPVVAIAPFWGDSDSPATLDAVAAKVKQAATAAGGTYADLPDPIHGHPDFMSDAADPDDDGYAAIAKALEPVLTNLLT